MGVRGSVRGRAAVGDPSAGGREGGESAPVRAPTYASSVVAAPSPASSVVVCRDRNEDDGSNLVATPARTDDVADLRGDLDKSLHALILEHLAKLASYVPGPVKKRGDRDKLLVAYVQDPVYNIFGLDSIEYLAATLSGGTVTSIHRKLGDIYESCVKQIFMHRFGLPPADVIYSAVIRSGDGTENRSADAFLQFDRLDTKSRKRVAAYCRAEVRKLAADPKIDLVGVGMEVRHCYQTGDSKRTQADEAMARHLLLSGILPVMPLFCNQSNPGIVSRYRSVWIIKTGMDAYDMIDEFSGYDFYDFLRRNREDFRKPVIDLLRNLTT